MMNWVYDMKIMFVCTGNTCRSPMAEVIFKSIKSDIEVSSAGIFALTGSNASPEAIEICKNHGLDLSEHRSCNIDDSDINEMDLVLTATLEHANLLKRSYPNLNVYSIKEYAGVYEDFDIKDPICGGLSDYEECFLEIRDALENIADNLNF